MEKTDTSGRSGVLTDDDIRLWRTAMREVRPLAGDRAAPAPTAAPDLSPPAANIGKEGAARKNVGTKPVPTAPARPARLPALKHGVTPGLDKRRAERLRRGQLSVEGRIDLHGMTQEAARRALDAFLAASYAAERRMLLVITGKGLRPNARAEDATGVLRRAVPRWLNESPNRERVLAFTHAQPRDGGSGALYVLLRRRRASS